GLHTGPLKYHPDNSTLIPKLGRSPGPGSPQPAPAGSSLPKPPAPTSYLGFSFCESSNREGGGQREQLSSGQSNSCVSRQTAVWARFLPLHQRGGRKGLSPVTLLRPVFWNRTWRTMRMEPRPLRSRMGEPAPGQGQKPPALEFLFTPSLLSAPYPAGTPSSSLCTIPQDVIMTPVPKGPLAPLPLPPHRAHLSCRDSGRTSIRSSQWSFSNISTSTQRSYNACCSWTQHPLIQKNHRVVLASFLLLLLGL
ncbi:hypothetical protein E2I00_011605, partial [Balaenoptera physalus]